jgi:hypothetical protein
MNMHLFRKSLASGVLALVIAFYPGFAIVNANTPTDTTTPATTEATSTDMTAPTPPAPEPVATAQEQPAPPSTGPQEPTGAGTTGPTQPNGAGSDTYTYDESTGLWGNGHYTWDPNTHQSAPVEDQAYSYNPSTGMWDTTTWVYDAPSGTYVPNTVSTSQPPADAAISALSSDDNSANQVNQNSENSGSFNGFYNASISGSINSVAHTGNALLSGNTIGGNATSGDALVMANLFNLLQSSASFIGDGGKLVTFNANLQGDVVGDLLIDPGKAANKLNATNGSSPMDNITVNNQANGTINANVTLDAQSGSATIDSNTQAGNATTGDADAVANVVNLLNSTIGAGQSFLGAVNIYGNLDGDILLPPGFLDSLLASNAPGSANTASQTGSSSLDATLTNNQTIKNDIDATAHTGSATLTNNTQAGNATTGDALTNLTVLNLSSSDVIGTNNLLVFVNVLGQWYGVIMDAPAGTTAASVGGGITKNSLAQAQNTEINSTTNSAINNAIDVNAKTGDALISNNTRAGNAKSGDATASVNLVNFVNSHLALSDWFGILFINVFGTWNGSFGVNTAAGNSPSTGGSNAPAPAPNQTAANTQVFRFVPKSNGNGGNTSYSIAPANGSGDAVDTEISDKLLPAVLASAKASPAATNTATIQPTGAQTSPQRAAWLMPAIGLTLGALLLAAERLVARRQRN